MVFVFGLAANLIALIFYKYIDFFIHNINVILDSDIPYVNVILPIGISFFTFQSISYLVDVYRGKVICQKNPFNLGLYISLFPQLIAGPIVRYEDVNQQITTRTITIEKFSIGVRRFIIGLAKKVLIANPMAIIADQAFGLGSSDLSTGGSLAWHYSLYLTDIL